MVAVRVLLIGAIALLGVREAAIEAAPVGALVVTASAPKPGTSSIVTFEVKLDFDVKLGGMQTSTSTTQSRKKKVEIVAVDADGTVHKRITYIQRDTRTVVDGELKKDPSVIRGKSYLVTWKDTLVDVKLASGKPASAEEVTAVSREEVQLQAPELLGRALAGVRLVEGQPFEVPLAALDKLIKGDYRPRRMVLTYRGQVPDGARIDVEGLLVGEGGGMKTFLDLHGELVLDATGWCRSTKVTSQIRSEFNGVVVGSGAGAATILATALR